MSLTYWQATWLVLIPAVLYACWMDWKERRVPNWLNAAIAAAGLAFQGTYFGWAGLSAAALGMLVGFGMLIGFWLMHAMGAGDVKLMAAIGAWFGPMMTFAAFCLGALIGGVLAMVMIVSAGKFWQALTNLQTIVVKARRLDTLFGDFGSAKSFGSTSMLLPYGVPLTIGSIIILMGETFSWWVL